MPKILDRVEAEKKIFENSNGTIKLLEYNGTSKKAHFSCNVCGHDWWTQGGSVINQGTGCGRCVGKSEYTYNEIKNIIEISGCKLISEMYKGIYVPLQVLFLCGHEGEIEIMGFLKKNIKVCKKCAFAQRMEDRRVKTEKKIAIYVESFGFELLEFVDGYKNSYSKIKYRCKYGHCTIRAVNSFNTSPHCYECANIWKIINYSGKNNYNYVGATKIRYFMNDRLINWRKESINKSDSKCIITGLKYEVVHHIYAFNLILKEALNYLNLPTKEKVDDYSQDEIIKLENLIIELHKKYPGVALTKKVHNLFHSIYKTGNNTPEQWLEFTNNIKNGNIVIQEAI